MSVYRWAIRNGAPILFWISLFVFVMTFAGQYLLGVSADGTMQFSREPGHSPGRLWFFVMAFSGALSNSALIFASACILSLLERRFSDTKGDER